MPSRLNDDEHEHDPDALTLPGNKVEKRSRKKGPRDPKRREAKADNDDS